MYKQNPKSPLMKAMLGDLNKDGKMSSYETARQNAIEKSMAKSPAKMKGPSIQQKAEAEGKAVKKRLMKKRIGPKTFSPAKKHCY